MHHWINISSSSSFLWIAFALVIGRISVIRLSLWSIIFYLTPSKTQNVCAEHLIKEHVSYSSSRYWFPIIIFLCICFFTVFTESYHGFVSDSMSGGAVAGIVLGVLVAGVIGSVVGYFLYRKKNKVSKVNSCFHSLTASNANINTNER